MATLSLESLRHSLSQAASTVYPFSGDDDESDSDSFESSFGASSASLTLSGSSPVSVKNGQSPHEKKDAQRMLRAKLFVLTVLMLSACVIGITLFFVVRKENKENFESEFTAAAEQLLVGISQRTNTMMESYIRLAHSITGYSLGLSLSWPNVTIPDFASELSQMRRQLNADSISYCPIVTEAQRTEWENYSKENQGWVDISLMLENSGSEAETLPSIREKVEPVSEDSFAVYAPIWQVSPIESYHGSINFDSLTFVESLYRTLENVPQPTFTNFEYRDLFEIGQIDFDDTTYWPRSFMSQAVFDRPLDDGELGSAHTMVAITHAYFGWHTLLQNQLTSLSVPGMDVVLTNTCGDINTIAYRLHGENVTFLGTDYTPNSDYIHLAQSANEDTLPTLLGCAMTLRVYASEEFHSYYETRVPLYLLLAIFGFFVTAALAFLIYDYAVEIRRRLFMAKVKRSNAIVESLFPTQVRDRLIAEATKEEEGPANTLANAGAAKLFKANNNNNTNNRSSEPVHFIPETPTLGGSRPIADLYPHSTIMFANISGFTAWSSVREPTQVFTLLEAVYSGFDKLAKSHRVFKVETIGDSYVAAAGLPEKRKDHAVAMARYARDCVLSMQGVVQQLEIYLGPDTADLEVRVGLHSGPVTAGVLRGEKSRFQLFGDTVNTAARMEATGAESRVHISKETADLLITAGKTNWVLPRGELVEAKGKGKMQTYWLKFRVQASSKDSADSSEEEDLLDTLADGHTPKDDMKETRLINWNIEILTRLLQKIIAMRRRDGESESDRTNESARVAAIERGMGESSILDEVKEIISLTNKSSKLKCDPSTVVLGPVVEGQLRDYVTTVAAMYRRNPFHNFEHASHVTQSMTKFISRIVTPEEIDYRDMTYKKKGATREIHEFTYGITSDPLIEFACTISALIHDMDHPGVPNAILVKESSEMAVLYDNKSVAEQNSVQLAWDLLMEPNYEELRKVIYTTQSEMERFRSLVVNSVMATDIADKELGQLRKNRWEKAFSNELSALPESPVDAVNRKATIVIEHLIQAADVAHTMQHWHVYQKWNERLFREMYDSYLNGRSNVDPSEGWYKGELGFFDFYIIPLAMKLNDCGVFGVSSDECLEYAKANRLEWERKGEGIVKEYLDSYLKEARLRRAPSSKITDIAIGNPQAPK